ncbi:MAG: ABC transporter substrate-binding protein, partial [bacterium]
LTPSASSPDVTANKDNVFQVCFTDPAQGTASAQYIKEHDLATKIAIIYNNADAYSTGIYQTFVDEAPALGLEIVSTTTFTDETTDFSVQVSDAKDNGADLVFLPIYYTPASMILQTAKSMDFAPVFFGVDGMDGILTMEGFDPALAEGVFMLTPFSADAEDEATKAFVARYQEITGEIPNQFAADCYDAVYALYNASIAAGIDGSTSPEDACELLIEQFKTLSVSGLTGDMTWDESGAVTKVPTAVVIQDGAYVGFNG